MAEPNSTASPGPDQTASPLILPHEKRFLTWFTVATLVVCSATFLLGHLLASQGQAYLGFPFNTDDHMVYSAWMWQAGHGNFLLDNRFTTLSQPKLTIHLYFWVLGLVARFVGISLTSNLARIALIAGVIPLLYRLIATATPSIYARKLCLTLATFGGGIGFLVWEDFGRKLAQHQTLWLAPLTGGMLPTDVWQPEGYLFSSFLTNGLFVIADLLILVTLIAVLEVKKPQQKSWLIAGIVAFGVLMNIHSYDCLLICLILIGFLVTTFKSKLSDIAWASKVVLIGLGAIPAALWFVYVMRHDPVFASRAATPTFAGSFKSELFGYLPLILVAIPYLAKDIGKVNRSKTIGVALLGLLIVGLYAAPVPTTGYFLTPVAFGFALAVALVALYLMASDNLTQELVKAWAIIGLIAPYFPALFERKLAMGLAIPWGILAGLGLYQLTQTKLRSSRNLASVFFLLLISGSSFQWFFRQIRLMQANVSTTTMQPAYLTTNEQQIVKYLDDKSSLGPVNVVAIPGIPSPITDPDTGKPVPDLFGAPLVPDLNPILSGLAGVYTYAGHWSETPDYIARRNASMSNLFSAKASPDVQRLFLDQTGAQYIVTLSPGTLPHSPFADLSKFGNVVVKGSQFELIAVNQPSTHS